MYDMYTWNEPASPADEHAEASPVAEPSPAVPAAPVAEAVQVALDRRDNGGAAAR